jgi:uncharacterized protein DUF4136
MEWMMRERQQVAVFGLALAFVAACAGDQATVAYNPDAGFSSFRTFAMVSRPDSASPQLIDDRARAAIQTQLEAKGLRDTTRQGADLLVGYGIVDRTNKDVAKANWDWAPAWGWRYYRWGVAWPADFQHDAGDYTDGTVVVYLVNARTRRVVWQAQAPDVLLLPPGSPAHASEQIDGAVAALFTKFPASSKG